MTFKELLAQVIAWLQQDQRVSYRALKAQFGLDDDVLEALKDELIYAKRLAIDEDGRVLVWTAGVSVSPAPAPQRPSQRPCLPRREPIPPQPDAPPVAPPPDAERRLLTVLFCDLVDSTRPTRPLRPVAPLWYSEERSYGSACMQYGKGQR